MALEFCPLRAGSCMGRLDASCSELGVLSYDLELEATPAGPEPVTYFETSVGQRHTRVLRFCNGAKVKTEFLTKVSFSEKKNISYRPVRKMPDISLPRNSKYHELIFGD